MTEITQKEIDESGMKKLAMSVFARAIEDMAPKWAVLHRNLAKSGFSGKWQLQELARAQRNYDDARVFFMNGGTMFRFWSACAGKDPDVFHASAVKNINNIRRLKHEIEC